MTRWMDAVVMRAAGGPDVLPVERVAEPRSGRAGGDDVRGLIEQSVGCAGFWMRHVVDDRELLCRIAGALFGFARQGRLVAHVDRVVGLGDVAAAHAALVGRATVGKVLVDVNRER